MAKSKYSFHMDRKSVTFVIKELMNNPNLNDWEKGFIQNINEHYIVHNCYMSNKQYEMLSKMWEKY